MKPSTAQLLLMAACVPFTWLVANYVVPAWVWDATQDPTGFKALAIWSSGLFLAMLICNRIFPGGPTPPRNDSGME